MLTDEQAVKNLSTNLRRLLADRGMSQAELARTIGESEMNVSRYVRGANVPGVGTLARLSEAFGVPADYLLSNKIAKKVG